MCQKDLRKDINANPPKVESREALSVWVCERHNEVNRKLNKPVKSCALKDLDERWRAKQ
jgi:FAD-linked sulfhydryl oxidase